MSLADDVRNAKAALDRLNAFTTEMFSASGREANRQHDKLKKKAKTAIDKLPKDMRTEMSAALAKFKNK
jgi:ElaB/YqjD/DUF883 family membrane-anchored ribosome-binding protein